MKRRTVLATAGGLAVGTPTAAVAQETDGGDDAECETVEIPVARSGDEVIATEEVPEAWHEQTERTEAVHEELVAEYRDEPWYVSSGITASDEEICGMSAMAIRVSASDVEEAKTHIKDERDGVPIRLEEGGRDGVELDSGAGNGTDGDGSAALESGTGTETDDREGAMDSENDDRGEGAESENGDDDGGTEPESDDQDEGTDTPVADGTPDPENASEPDGTESGSEPDDDELVGVGILGALGSLGGAGYLLVRRDDER